MTGYVRPVLTDGGIRRDGRKAIGSVSARHSAAAARRLVRDSAVLVSLLWAAEDRVFPIEHARRYADALGAQPRTVADSYTYLAEDQPERTAEALRGLLTEPS
ncbi:alpha/beta fold hydrolase [Amycolatopsis sp. CA-230715]|uniref:alpha/beta fold hydrolase n=1 Tax=Amycolatopsis sp. CA-230715 TaxID=2745196 RepID=UPI001C024222|nr:hypothetical protein [Amycolatopsis sp. CA-230715]QWF76683.1 hypothetical protein HUW46_00059 [Amycolatopsis sp. CA-230715]